MYIKALELEDVKKGVVVEVYRINQGFQDIKIARVSRIKGYIRTEYSDGFWENHTWFWPAGSHAKTVDPVKQAQREDLAHIFVSRTVEGGLLDE